VVDLEEDNDPVEFGMEIARFGGGGMPAHQQAMTSL
jgi:hypothetical protein